MKTETLEFLPLIVTKEDKFPNTDLNIYGLNVSGGYRLSDRISIDASLNYGRQESDNYPNLGYGSQSYLYSIMWLGANVDLREMEN